MLSAAKPANPGISAAVAALLAISATPQPALARKNNVKVSFSGTVNAGVIDTYGYFGPKGGDLGGLSFTAAFAYNTSDFARLGHHIYQTKTAKLARTITSSLTINGISQKEIPTAQVVVQIDGGGIFIYRAKEGELTMTYSSFGSLANPGSPASAVQFNLDQGSNENEEIEATTTDSMRGSQ
jgi:hypothetical protein